MWRTNGLCPDAKRRQTNHSCVSRFETGVTVGTEKKIMWHRSCERNIRSMCPLRLSVAIVGAVIGYPTLVFAQDQSGNNPWLFETPDAMALLILTGLLALFVGLGIGAYRSMLKSQVRQFVHPHTLAWTITFSAVLAYLWIFFAVLFGMGFIGWGIGAVLWGVFFLALLVLILVGRVLKWALFLIFLILAAAVFQVMIAL